MLMCEHLKTHTQREREPTRLSLCDLATRAFGQVARDKGCTRCCSRAWERTGAQTAAVRLGLADRSACFDLQTLWAFFSCFARGGAIGSCSSRTCAKQADAPNISQRGHAATLEVRPSLDRLLFRGRSPRRRRAPPPERSPLALAETPALVMCARSRRCRRWEPGEAAPASPARAGPGR